MQRGAYELPEVTLQLRIYAMYHGSKKVLVSMIVILALSVGISVGLLVTDIQILGCTFYGFMSMRS